MILGNQRPNRESPLVIAMIENRNKSRGSLMVRPTASQAEGRGFKSGLAPLSFSEFMCEIELVICHELFGEGKHREETCIHLRSNSMMCVKFLIHTGPAWGL